MDTSPFSLFGGHGNQLLELYLQQALTYHEKQTAVLNACAAHRVRFGAEFLLHIGCGEVWRARLNVPASFWSDYQAPMGPSLVVQVLRDGQWLDGLRDSPEAISARSEPLSSHTFESMRAR